MGAILQRATEIQSGLTPETEAPGVTLGELQKVASEIGIEPGIVERAAREIQAKTRHVEQDKNPTTRTFDQTVDGLVSEEAWDDIVATLRQSVGQAGTATIQGSSREWSAGWEIGTLTFTATSRHGKTRFRMLINTTGASVLGWVVAFAGGMLATALTSAILKKSGAGGAIIAMGAFLAIATVGLTTFFSIRVGQKKAQRRAAQLFATILAEANLSPEELPQ